MTWGARDVSVLAGSGRALDHVTLAVPAGQVTAVVGGDGAGKTTLLRCLAGTLAPGAGEVRAPGRDRTGYLPGSSGIYPDLTVAENLAFRATAYAMPGPAARQRAADLTALAGLTAARDRLAGQLSGGMRQKLGVICALLHEPDLLILDEPTTGVDPVSRAGLWQLISGAAASGAAVVLATTYLAEAERAASVLVLDAGQALAAGTPGEILAGVPGAITAPDGPPGPDTRPRSWRRGGRWLTWSPPGTQPPAGQPVTPDLQDAVTVAALARETGADPGTEPGADPGLAGPPGAGRRRPEPAAAPGAAWHRTGPAGTDGAGRCPAGGSGPAAG